MTRISDDDGSREDIVNAIAALVAGGGTCLNAGVRQGLTVS